MSETSIDTMRDHHPTPPTPLAPAPPGPQRRDGTPAAAGPPPARDVCERMPLLARPACWANGRLGLNPPAPRPRERFPALARAAASYRQAAPARAREGLAAKVVDKATKLAEVAHVVAEGAEHLAPRVATAAAVLGPLSGLGAFVKFNLEQSRANRDGNLAARAHATAAGFAKVLAATMADGAPRGVARRADLWPVPSSIANRYDEDYRAGVRAALDAVAGYTPDQVARMRRELEQATPNVNPQPGEQPVRLLERRLAVLLGGYAGRADLRF